MYFINPYRLILDVKKLSHDGKEQIDPQKMIDVIKSQPMWRTIPSDKAEERVVIDKVDDNDDDIIMIRSTL